MADPTTNDHLSVSRLTLYYLLALLLIAMVNVSAYIVVNTLTHDYSQDAPLLNLSGRQRMLSQRLAKETLMIVLADDDATAATHREILKEALTDWKQVHRGLMEGSAQLRLRGEKSPTVARYLEEVDRHFKGAVAAISTVVAADAEALAALTPDSPIIKEVTRTSDAFLESMDRTVFQYEAETRERVHRLDSTEDLILASALVLLLLEALFIFRPMIRLVWSAYLEARALNERLAAEIEERQRLELEKETLEGLLPICSSCKKIRGEDDSWQFLEPYIEKRSEVSFTHSMCPDCRDRLYPPRKG